MTLGNFTPNMRRKKIKEKNVRIYLKDEEKKFLSIISYKTVNFVFDLQD